MKSAFLVVLSFFLVNACAKTDWASYPLTERLTVRLPSPPETVNLMEQKGLPEVAAATLHRIQAFKSSDDYGVYTILITPVDSAALALLPRDSLYNNGLRQMLQAYGGRVLTRTTFNTPVGSGVEVLMDAAVPKIGKHVLTGVRLVMDRQQRYAFVSVPYAETDSSRATMCRRHFFDSITVTP